MLKDILCLRLFRGRWVMNLWELTPEWWLKHFAVASSWFSARRKGMTQLKVLGRVALIQSNTPTFLWWNPPISPYAWLLCHFAVSFCSFRQGRSLSFDHPAFSVRVGMMRSSKLLNLWVKCNSLILFSWSLERNERMMMPVLQVCQVAKSFSLCSRNESTVAFHILRTRNSSSHCLCTEIFNLENNDVGNGSAFMSGRVLLKATYLLVFSFPHF